jgi:glycosyltransferase involved in cell wall biosynthesis
LTFGLNCGIIIVEANDNKMLVSIFTPSNNSKFLPLIFESLKKQTDPNWEWAILYNNGAEPLKFDDPRVKTHYVYNAPEWVGPLKAAACGLCSGDILVECDHDDFLMPTAVEEVKKAFEDPEIGFVYSNTIHASGDMGKIQRFSEYFGWKYREVEVDGHSLDEHISFEPTPESISRIWFAPNHLRAFRKSVYDQIGGYNKEMRILDDLDLMCRMYLVTKFKHINKGLYVYRVHGANSWIRYNAEIQNNVYRIYDQYIVPLVERWCSTRGLRRIELGGRFDARQGYETVDLKDADIICDLNEKWPFKDNSIAIIRAYDVFEHLKDPIHTMSELSRVLVPGGWVFGRVPSTDGRGAFCDPTHISFWNERSFGYYTNANLAKYIDFRGGRWQAPRLYTDDLNAEKVCWVNFHLISCKDNYRPCGSLDL